MRLRLKILSGFLTLALMLSIAGIWSIYELKSIGTSVQDLLDDNYKSINAAKLMIESLERQDSAILLLILGKWREGRSILASADSVFERGYKVASHNLTIPNEKFYVDSIQIAYQSYKNIWKRPIVDTDKQGNLDWYFQTTHTAFLKVKASVNSLMALNDSTMFKTASDLKSMANRAVMPGIVAIVAALIFSFLFNYFVNHYLISPIVKIANNAKNFVEHNVPFDVKVETRDELSDLAVSVETLCSFAKSMREHS